MLSLIFTRRNPLSLKELFLMLSITVLLAFSGKTYGQDDLVGLTSNGGAESGGTAFSIKSNGTGFGVFRTFANWGALPFDNLVKGADGQLYGMASEGGIYGHGTIFKVSPAGAVTVLKNLNLPVDGGYPKGSLVLASDGNFYGTMSTGSINNGGAIFRMTPSGVFTILRSLSINTDGGRPNGSLVQGRDGNLYGINYAGGSFGYGSIFKITLAGAYTVLKAFNGTTDGANSYGSLMQASDGNFYGMTYLGGTLRYGVIFRITPAGVYTVLRNFNGTTDGGYPSGDLVQGRDGLLYGMSPNGGASYNGTIFKISTSGAFTLIKSLSAAVEGGTPKGSLIQATDGNFYGMTYSASGGFHGTIFRMTPAGAVTVLKKFTGPTDGGYPNGGLVQHSDGNFYGMTGDGGKNFYGTIFKITPTAVYTVLAHFNGAANGNTPQEHLTLGKDSAYYGVTSKGGLYNYGTIYRICGGNITVLRSFNKNVDGGAPVGSLVRASDGNLYGMTESGGVNSAGTIFRITPAGVFTVLRHLKSTTDGGNPKGSLVQGADGALYGMANIGGTATSGTIFKITTAGVFTVLRHITAATDGAYPEGTLAIGNDGNFYGMTGQNSRFFRVTPAGVFTVLATFAYATHGNLAAGSLVIGADGNFYGANGNGGTNGVGTIFKVTPTGAITILRHLVSATDGGNPKGGLLKGTDGNFYGMNSTGGTNKVGTIFRISPTGAFAVLRHFNIVTDGGMPTGGLILSPKATIIANPQSNIATTEDVTKAIVLSGSGSTALTYNIVSNPRNGVITGTGANRTYTPNPNYSGRDSFAFAVGVGCLWSTPAVVSFVVNPVNDAPVLATIGNKTVVRGALLSFTATATDVDAGQTKTFSLITPPSGAVINSSTGAFSWTPSVAGSFTVKVRVADNGSPLLFDEETITVTVTNPVGISAQAAEEKQSVSDLKGLRAGKAGLYPNPVTDRCTITLDQAFDQVSTLVTDSKGAIVVANRHRISGNNRIDMDVSALKTGQYFVRVQTGTEVSTFRFIKQ